MKIPYFIHIYYIHLYPEERNAFKWSDFPLLSFSTNTAGFYSLEPKRSPLYEAVRFAITTMLIKTENLLLYQKHLNSTSYFVYDLISRCFCHVVHNN